MANENLYAFNGYGPKISPANSDSSRECVWVPWCVCLCAHIALSLYHTFEVILVDGFCDVALPHFEIKDSSKICRFFLFLMCLYGCMSVVRVHRSFISKMLSVFFLFCSLFGFLLVCLEFLLTKKKTKKTLLQSLQFLWGLTPKKAATMLQFTKGSKLFTDYSPRFWLFSKDPSTVYVH